MKPLAEGPVRDERGWLDAALLRERVEEEISRSERHGTALSFLIVAPENLQELARRHGEELREEAMAYLASVLARELRRFDSIGRAGEDELALVLPGADEARGEMVARRVLERLRAVKVEAGGARIALRLSVGLVAWREGVSAATLLEMARAAAHAGAEEQGNNT